MSQQGLRRRVQELAAVIEDCAKDDSALVCKKRDAADLRALLAAHAKAKRELAIMKAELRGIMCDSFSHSTNERIRAGLKEKGVTL